MPDPTTRPDLVSVLQDSIDTHTIVVTELKSPNIPLDQDAESQLVRYMEQIRVIMRAAGDDHVVVRGFLIGTLPDAQTKNPKELVLLNDYRKQTAESDVQIVTLDDMLRHAYTIYVDAIKALETDEQEQDEEEGEGEEIVREVVQLSLPTPPPAAPQSPA